MTEHLHTRLEIFGKRSKRLCAIIIIIIKRDQNSGLGHFDDDDDDDVLQWWYRVLQKKKKIWCLTMPLWKWKSSGAIIDYFFDVLKVLWLALSSLLTQL